MAHDLNRCEFIGRLGKDPEIRYTKDGEAVASLSIAVGKSWTDKNSGELKEQVTWVPLTMFGKLAEIAGEWLKKGTQVYVAGEFNVRKWQDKEGNDRWSTDIRVDKMQMLGKKPDGEGNAPNPDAQPATTKDPAAPKKDYATESGSSRKKAPAKTGSGFDDLEDDIPFMNPYRGAVLYVV